MDNAKKLITIRDTDEESAFGYVYSVSGPGESPFEIMQLALVTMHLGIPTDFCYALKSSWQSE